MDKRPKAGTLSMGFSFLTGGMLLSFAAIESFSASVAFTMRSDERIAGFDFEQYQKTKRFWGKMELLMSAVGIHIVRSQGLFRDIGDMQRWRNLVTHASPYEIEPTIIDNTTTRPAQLHNKFRHLEYARNVNTRNAKTFYKTAVDYIELVRQHRGRG